MVTGVGEQLLHIIKESGGNVTATDLCAMVTLIIALESAN